MLTTATAKAKTTEPGGAFTPIEMWRAVAALRISLDPPRGNDGSWLAGFAAVNAETGRKRYEWGWGETPLEAVADLLQRIGESAQ